MEWCSVLLYESYLLSEDDLISSSSIFLAPPVIVFSSACAGLAGHVYQTVREYSGSGNGNGMGKQCGAVPALAQLASSSYHAAFSSLPPPSSSSQDDQIHKSRTSSTF
ncbi:hypothetical protein TIFTF001_030097 [Ficus carica]|uniref:Uncharacterized protein n=1 Tax=Ficus carica TaxID=3494 RepID=A0AA88DWZ8_FICCA|nr:hypothetical protein TIFTF001_030097 [Ficus carica]